MGRRVAGPRYAPVMGQDPPKPTPAALLTRARELRDAAVNADRPDVAAKAEEAIALIAGAHDAAADREAVTGGDKGNTVIRVLDGLGF
jgi:hypothetical protein